MTCRGQQRSDRREDLIKGQLLGHTEVAMPDRYVPCGTWCNRKGEPDQFSTQGIQAGGLGIKGKALGTLQGSQHLCKIGIIEYRSITFTANSGTRIGRELLQQLMKLTFLKDLRECFPVRLDDSKGVVVKIKFEIIDQGDQP